MGEAQRLYKDSIPESLYNSIVEERDYLRGLIGNLAVDKIKTMEDTINTLKLSKAKAEGQVIELKEKITDLNKSHKAEINRLAKAHNDGRERQRGKWEADIRSLEADINNKDRKIIELGHKIKELEADINSKDTKIKELEHELDKEFVKVTVLNTMDEKLDTIIDKINSIIADLDNMRDKDYTKEEVIDSIKNKLDTIKDTDARIEYECRVIKDMTDKGCTIEQIADKLYPGVKRGKSKVSERKRHPIYASITGGD